MKTFNDSIKFIEIRRTRQLTKYRIHTERWNYIYLACKMLKWLRQTRQKLLRNKNKPRVRFNPRITVKTFNLTSDEKYDKKRVLREILFKINNYHHLNYV